MSDHLEPPARLKTLIHEWAHISLGHDKRLTDRRDLQEIEAESTAFLLCATIGVDSATYSGPNLASRAKGDPQLLGQTAQTVLASTAKMIDSRFVATTQLPASSSRFGRISPSKPPHRRGRHPRQPPLQRRRRVGRHMEILYLLRWSLSPNRLR